MRREGTKMPAGTAHPLVIAARKKRNTARMKKIKKERSDKRERE